MSLTPHHSDLKNMFEITRAVYAAFWMSPSPSTPMYDYLQSTIKQRSLKPDSAVFLSTFSALSFLASYKAVETYKKDMATFLTQIWNVRVERQDGPPVTGESFSYLTYLSIGIGVQGPFLLLYSLYFQSSLDPDAKLAQCAYPSATEYSSGCMQRPLSSLAGV